MRMIDLFSGVGGLSLGLQTAGFESVLAIDSDRNSCRTYSELVQASDLLNEPIENIDFKHLAGHIELVAGGPPCQPFSSGGKRFAHKDSRNMIPQYFRVIDEVRPLAFLMENVLGLRHKARWDYINTYLKEFMKLGYEISTQMLNAADYGVPQKRMRLFIVGSKVGFYEFPAPSHGPQGNQPHEKAGDYLSRDKIIGEPNNSIISYAKNPDPRPSPYDGHLFNGGGRPINLNDTCPTIIASAGGNKTHFIDTLNEVPVYHAELLQGKPPREGLLPGGRRITVAESAIIQTFPPDTSFHGSKSSQYTQVGNAVPPLLAEKIGRALASLLDRPLSKIKVV